MHSNPYFIIASSEYRFICNSREVIFFFHHQSDINENVLRRNGVDHLYKWVTFCSITEGWKDIFNHIHRFDTATGLLALTIIKTVSLLSNVGY